MSIVETQHHLLLRSRDAVSSRFFFSTTGGPVGLLCYTVEDRQLRFEFELYLMHPCKSLLFSSPCCILPLCIPVSHALDLARGYW